MKKLIAVLFAITLALSGALVPMPMFAQTYCEQSPYVGDMPGGDFGEGQDHFVVISHKTGAGCRDCALLFVSYERVKMLYPSLFSRVWPKINLKEYHHAGLYFVKWDIEHGKLYLKAYANYSPPEPAKGFSDEWLIEYDLRDNTFTVGPRTPFDPSKA